MPNPLTHQYFGERVFDAFPDLKKTLKKELAVYDYATMGPDVMYGLKLGSDVWKGGWGEYCHGHHIRETFVRAARTLENTKRDKLWRERCAYALGLLSHYVLDSRMHSYVYDYEHNRLPDKVEKEYDENIHMLIEAAFDYHILVDVKGRSNKERAYRLFKWNGKTSKAMQDFYNYAVGDLYPFVISDIDRVFTTNVFALVAFLSHKASKLKYKVTRFIEKKTGFKHLLTAGYRTGLGRADWDILNLNRKPFDLVAAGKDRPSTETFDEVFERAISDCKNYFIAFQKAIDGDWSEFDRLDFSLDYDALPVKDSDKTS